MNCRDSFPRRKFENWAPTSCSPGSVLSPPAITFELHAKVAEEIDLEVQFSQLGKLRDLDLDLDLRSGRDHTGAHMWSRSTHIQIRGKSEKHSVDVRTDGRNYTDGRTHLSSNLHSEP